VVPVATSVILSVAKNPSTLNYYETLANFLTGMLPGKKVGECHAAPGTPGILRFRSE